MKSINLFTVQCSKCNAPNDWDRDNPSEKVVLTEGNKYRVACTRCQHVEDYDAKQAKSSWLVVDT
jgi:endogenous inhibitor of DNA gyrase (YacG/DUF329 family)